MAIAMLNSKLVFDQSLNKDVITAILNSSFLNTSTDLLAL